MSEMPTPRLRGAGALPGRERLVSLDLLRITVVAMVIVHHAAQPYGPSGPNWPVTDAAQSDWFRPFYTVNAALGLGLLFLLAGHFVPPAHDRKGPRRFLRDRWSRLGVPMVVFVVVANLPIALATEQPESVAGFVTALYDDAWTPVYLHLWFVLHLLLYSLAYVAWRRVARGHPRALAPPGHGVILAFTLGLVAVTWVVRWWFPIDEWVPLLGLVPVEPARLPQYAALFVVGVMAFRGDWVRGVTSRVGRTWLAVGLAASVCMAVVQSAAPSSWRYNELANSGPGWQSLLRAALEGFVCVGLAVGLIVLFRDLVRRPLPWIGTLAATSYAAYVLHLYIVVPLQAGMTRPDLSPLLKFGVVATLALLLSFGAARGSRRVPGLRRLLGTAPSRPETGSTDESPRPGGSYRA